jgi:hypothetical protein
MSFCICLCISLSPWKSRLNGWCSCFVFGRSGIQITGHGLPSSIFTVIFPNLSKKNILQVETGHYDFLPLYLLTLHVFYCWNMLLNNSWKKRNCPHPVKHALINTISVHVVGCKLLHLLPWAPWRWAFAKHDVWVALDTWPSFRRHVSWFIRQCEQRSS